MKTLDYLVKRLCKLSESLSDLKERVREAVAGELSRVVAQTVQEVVNTFIRGRPEPPPRETPPEPEWPEADPWAEDPEEYAPVPTRMEPLKEEVAPLSPPPADRWQQALQIGTTVLRWWLAGRWKPIIGVGVAGLAGAAAWWGGPMVHAGTGVVITAAELIAFGTSHSLR